MPLTKRHNRRVIRELDADEALPLMVLAQATRGASVEELVRVLDAGWPVFDAGGVLFGSRPAFELALDHVRGGAANG